MLSVTEQQKYLKKCGYYTGKIDGVKAKGTKSAIKMFQNSQHIFADGIWGKTTDSKAQALIKNNWKIGIVKYTLKKLNGTSQTLYVNEDIMISKSFKLSEYMMSATTIKNKKLKTNRNVVILYEKLIKADQKLRDALGKPIKITSGYREKTYNKAIGGASKSLHIDGKASDKVVEGMKPKKVQAYIIKHWKELGYGGLESKTLPNANNYTHADVRTTSKLIQF